MNRLARIADRVADDEVMVEFFSKHILLKYFISNSDNDLTLFERELAVARSKVMGKAMRIREMLKKMGYRGHILNVGITPRDGVVGVVVEFDYVLGADKQKMLLDAVG